MERPLNIERDRSSHDLVSGDRTDCGDRRTLALSLDSFTWEALAEQAAQLEISLDELAAFSVLYYLADLDSKRIARLIPTSLRKHSAER
jgi:hypothetical protein